MYGNLGPQLMKYFPLYNNMTALFLLLQVHLKRISYCHVNTVSLVLGSLVLNSSSTVTLLMSFVWFYRTTFADLNLLSSFSLVSLELLYSHPVARTSTR